jgi:hypothetical protein
MSLTLLEKQRTIQYPRSGALLNFHALGRQNGRLYGCQLVQSTSELIVLTTGVLVIQGFRVDVVDETVFNASLALKPATPLRYYIILRIEAGLEDTEMELLVTDEAPVNDTPIEERQGVFDYVLGVFNFGPAGISEFTSLIETIDTTVVSGPGGSIVSSGGWFDGTSVDGTDAPIFCSVDAVPGVEVGSYYINKDNGNYYKCIDVSSGLAFWNYRGNLRGPQGEGSDVEIGSDIENAIDNSKPAGELAVKEYVTSVLGGLADLLEEI